MTDILGTSVGETLNGTGDADNIFGFGGNDTVNAGAGNDTIYGGTGADTLNGEDGDDTFVENEITLAQDVFNGGIGFDTIELRAVAAPIQTGIGALSPHSLNLATSMSSIERIVFASQIGQTVQASLAFSLWQAAGITQIVGGAGRDIIGISVGAAAGNYTMQAVPVSNWDAPSLNAWEYGGDIIALSSSANASTSVTLNALNGATFMQSIAGGLGNDILNGSGNADLINASAGSDTVNAGDGNDAIIIANTWAANGTGWNSPSQFTGAGAVWNGGNGTDVVSIGGAVNLQATLSSIEGVFLQAAFIPTVPNTPRQDVAQLTLDSAHIAMLPGNAFFGGTGSVLFNISDGLSFSAANYVFAAGSSVNFEIYAGVGNGLTFSGSSGGDLIELNSGAQTAIGGGGNDRIAFGSGNQTATGGTGADTYRIGLGNGTVMDFTIGEDRIDFSGTDIFNESRLFDLLGESGGNAVIGATTVDGHFQITLSGISRASLTASDFILGIGDGGVDNETGTAADEFFFGQQNNDIYHGGGGADRFYGGGGVDQIFGEDGDDTIILDGAISPGGIYNGGAGFDTLRIRPSAGSIANGPATSYSIFTSAPGTGLVDVERIAFDSSASYGLTFITAFTSPFPEVVGGAGTDTLVLVAIGTGQFRMPNFTLSNWNGGIQPGQDALVLAVAQGQTAGATLIALSGVSQVLLGALGNDSLDGSNMADILRGNAGNDQLHGNGGADQLYGEAGDDEIVVGRESTGSLVDGGTGFDTLTVESLVSSLSLASISSIEQVSISGSANLVLSGSQFATGLAANTSLAGSGSITVNMETGYNFISSQFTNLNGSTVRFVVNGTTGTDVLKSVLDNAVTYNGGDGSDQMRGGNLADFILGDGGNDKIMGLGGADQLTGGAGADQFRYLFTSDTGMGVAADRILDFEVGIDWLDFRALDADPSTAGRQSLSFIGTSAFVANGTGQVRYETSGADLLVSIDYNGDGNADAQIVLAGDGGMALSGTDFLF